MRDSTAATKRRLAETREQIRAAHDRGLDPVRVCAKLTVAVDETIESLWRGVLEDLPPADADLLREDCVLVAHGGYGRRQLAPRSDVDLMILHGPKIADQARRLATRLTQDVFDVGLELGHSLRTRDDALRLAKSDAVIATSLLESRRLVGSQTLFDRFFHTYRDTLQRRGSSAAALFVAARRNELDRHGGTVYLLEPNIKRSRGGLRDVHLLRWLWFIQAGVSDLDRLRSMNVMSKFDHHRLCSARDFLLRVRNELHFGGASTGDTLHRSEQLRVAERLEYRGTAAMRPVESFMRDYFQHARHVNFMANRLADLATPRPTVARVLDPVLGRSVTRDYRVGLREVSATTEGMEKLKRRVDEALRLVDMARALDRRISQETWYAVYRAAPNYGEDLSPNAAERFLKILDNPRKLGKLLRRLHELAVLEKVIPEYGEARCLLQFNQMHEFTVDEHCLRAVEMATRFEERNDLLGQTYRALPDKAVLHLTLLLHDLGKGRTGDHSVIGEEIAERTGRRLGLTPEVTDTLKLLVRGHLKMSLLAFRRDTNDPDVIDRFAEWIGTPQRLALLYTLTCADIAAVGAGMLNDWKVGVLTELYLRTRSRLEGVGHDAQIQSTRDAIVARLSLAERRSGKFAARLEELPDWFVETRSAASTAGALRRLKRLQESDAERADAWGGYLHQAAVLEVVAAVIGGSGQGVFSKMTGALSGKGLRILSAETTLMADDLLLLRYTAEDPQATPTTNAAEANRRVKSITSAMVASLASDDPPRFPELWGADRAAADAALTPRTSSVRTDPEASSDSLLVEVKTLDRVGLLYELSRALHELGLITRSAKIATFGAEVVDVFYVTESDGSKPIDTGRLSEIADALTAVIESPS